MMVRIILLEVEYVLYLGSAEGVDRLGVIAHDAEVIVEHAELLENEILREVRILILIDHDVVE